MLTKPTKPTKPRTKQIYFQAMGVLKAKVAIKDAETFILVTNKHGTFSFPASHYNGLEKEIRKNDELYLLVYPIVKYYRGAKSKPTVKFFIRAWQTKPFYQYGLKPNEFLIKGLLKQSANKCFIRVEKNNSDQKTEWLNQLKNAAKKLRFVKGINLPILWKDCPSSDKTQKFVSIKCFFMPHNSIWGHLETYLVSDETPQKLADSPLISVLKKTLKNR